jgi:hypothetical protein
MKINQESPDKQNCFNGRRCSAYGPLEDEWKRLCEQYLPVASDVSIWRFSRESSGGGPEQGWKLHLSATVLTASRMLKAAAPVLHSKGLLFKAPATLFELNKINSGLHYGYSQVGKFLTIYPRTTKEAILLARRLHRLTYGLAAPSIPFDLKFQPDSCVHYRYGSFKLLEISNPDGTRTFALRNPQGELVPDLRDAETAKPHWVSDPFALKQQSPATSGSQTLLRTRFRVFAALSQRGKGGVYQALDLKSTPLRLCVLKEGRRYGEVCWDGRDGYARVRQEERVLSALSAAGVNVPRVYSSFRAEKNFYLAIEFIEGCNFNRWLSRRQRKLSMERALGYGVQLSEIISKIHAAGWVWRDCKPGNLILTSGGELRPLDFEGACPVNHPDASPWNTPFYEPPECSREFCGQSRLPEDLYALGAVLYLLIAGRVPDIQSRITVEKLRRKVPVRVCRLIEELLDDDPVQRPAAATVVRRLKSALRTLAGC